MSDTVVTDANRVMKSSTASTSNSSTRRVFAATLAKNNVTGLVAAGFYRGTKTEKGIYGEETFVLVEGIDGIQYEVKNAGNLIGQLTIKEVSPGDYIEVKYNGKKEATKGKLAGKSLHNFFVDIEVAE